MILQKILKNKDILENFMRIHGLASILPELE